MGRWSRSVAREFVEWLKPSASQHWLDFGCGTGALTTTICSECDPAAVVGCDVADAFIAHAAGKVADARASFVVAGVDAFPSRIGGFDWIVSGLVLNFLPDPEQAVATMGQHLRPGGTLALYVWDYAGGVEFLRYFWEEAIASDPAAVALDEATRFRAYDAAALASLFRGAELERVDTTLLEVATDFSDFDDYWRPFLGGTGPAPSYVASLDPARRISLKQRLERRIPAGDDDRIQLRARAWAVRGISP
jgi:SAM-dependent methyltransferase